MVFTSTTFLILVICAPLTDETCAMFDRAAFQRMRNDAVLINVTRSGDTSAAAVVDYATADGTAGQRTKYEIAAGTIKFAAGETSQTIKLLINDNTYADGNQSFYLSLSNAGGSGLGLPILATITINDDDTTPAAANLTRPANGSPRSALGIAHPAPRLRTPPLVRTSSLLVALASGERTARPPRRQQSLRDPQVPGR